MTRVQVFGDPGESLFAKTVVQEQQPELVVDVGKGVGLAFFQFHIQGLESVLPILLGALSLLAKVLHRQHMPAV